MMNIAQIPGTISAPLAIKDYYRTQTTTKHLTMPFCNFNSLQRIKRILSSGVSFLVLTIFFNYIGVSCKEMSRLMAMNLLAADNIFKEDVCKNFSIHTANRTSGVFSSPNYPHNYPNGTDCYLIIEAPVDHNIVIHFLDKIQMEDSAENKEKCDGDYLEIREGKYGIPPDNEGEGRLCGNKPINDIISLKNALWLHFHSDDTIEYQGFKAEYHFVKKTDPAIQPPPECWFNLSGESGQINVSNQHLPPEMVEYSITNKVPLECIWKIEVPPPKKVSTNFTKYKLAKPNECEENRIYLYYDSLERMPVMKYCGTAAESKEAESSLAFIRLFIQHTSVNITFEFVVSFTAVRRITPPEQCTPDEFYCEDSTCIDSSLKCDGEANCRLRYDENKSECEEADDAFTSFDSNHMIIILILFFCLVIGMCASIVVSCWGKIKERRQREMEYKLRRSNEPSIECDLDHAITMTGIGPPLRYEYGSRGEDSVVGKNFVKSSTNLMMDPSSQEEDENGCYVPDMNFGVYRKQPNGGPSLLHDKYSPDLGHHPNCSLDHAISNECPFYRQHPLHQQHSHDTDNNRSGSESPIPPPPPPPAMSHLRGVRSARSATLPLNVTKLDTPESPPSVDNHHLHHHQGHHHPIPSLVHHPDCAQHGSSRIINPGDYRSASVGPSHHSVVSSYHHSVHPNSHPTSAARLASLDTEDGSDDKVPSSARHQRYRAEAKIEMSSNTANRPRSFIETRSAPDVVVLR
ncbi:tolloid-like protein 2 isoform X2 [Brevipalpus obovatus]|uniref:tolloid-like protein 2 isoform X2 n=1 Tax=Brevipalpus obovatus TaxID=246614 RepID=UPI003D9F8ACD